MTGSDKPQQLDRRITDPHSIGIEIRLLEFAYKNVIPMLTVNMAAASVATFVLVRDGLHSAVYWLAIVTILMLLRLWNWFRFNNAKKNNLIVNVHHLRYWRNTYAAGLYLAACLWVSIFYICIGLANQDSKYTISIIIAGMAGGATGITAPLKYEGRIYITILLLASSIAFALTGSADRVLALLGIIFLIAMVISHSNNHRIVRKSLTLQRENSQLVMDLQGANSSLERRVSKRTEALKRLAHHDTLTGLSNRRDIFEWMNKNLDATKAGEAAILFLDLDRFKQINDAMGHDIGDQVLQTIAARFKEIVPQNAVLGRWGGDEFILITAQAIDARGETEALAKKLIEIAIAPIEMNGEKLGIGLSVGIAYFPTDGDDYKDVIQAADLSVAEVKRSGRGKVLTYTESYSETQRRRFDLNRTLSDAILSNHLYLVYQPIIETRTGKVESLEALARWNHPELGNIAPEEFIHLAEDSDRIVALGEWILYTACMEARSWGLRDQPQKVAVNVSIKQLLSENFFAHVVDTLVLTDLPANRLQLEVTETLFNEENLAITLAKAKKLRQLGVEIHIDDFGTGYSSLSRLHQFPVNTIKIDRTFTANIHEHSSVIIESTVMIAKRMNLKVVAEGVETLEQAQAVAKLGVDFMQGYYLASPQIKAQLESVEVNWYQS